MTLPRVLVVGGVDPTGRAGIARDLATLESERVEPAVAVTALTIQDARGAHHVQPTTADILGRSLEAAASLGDLAAIKVGLVPNAELAEELRRFAQRMRVPLVVDPVLRASTGEALTTEGMREHLGGLLAEATLVTPNLDELEALQGPCREMEARIQAAKDLRTRRGPEAVLVKGGHGTESPGVDILVTDRVEALRFARLELAHPLFGRGKGCEFASRVAALLAKRLDLSPAVRVAQRRLQERLQGEVSWAREDTQAALDLYVGTLERLLAQLEPACVPEVGMNLAYAAQGVEDPSRVLGLAGRVTLAGPSFAVTGRPVPGGPHHTGRIAATAQRLTCAPVWVFNHRHDASFLPAEEGGHVELRREEEPARASSSMEWMTEAAIQRMGRLPSYVSDPGMPGKEAMIRVFASTPDELLARHEALHRRQVPSRLPSTAGRGRFARSAPV